MIYAAVLAGGSGRRFGAELPKQFLKLNGEEIILRTLRTFKKSGLFDRLIVCVSEGYADFTAKLLKFAETDADIVIGGSERFESLENCCRYISQKYGIGKEDILISQDSVRPFTTAEMAADCIKGVRECGFATAAVPLSDTVIQKSGGNIFVPDRSELSCIQTPQGFYIDEFLRLYSRLKADEKAGLTDASKVYILNGRPIKFTLGGRLNIKITSPEDMLLAEAIASRA